MPIGIAGAIIGSAAVGTVATLASADSARSASNRAVDAQTRSQDQNIALQREQMNYAREQNAPYQEAGVNALNVLSGEMSGQPSQFQADPGYQFRLEQGQKALDNSMLARGMGLSGSQQRASIDYNQGMASQEYGNWYNRLSNLAGIGQSATNSNINSGAAGAANIGNAYTGIGQAQAQGATNQANIYGNAASNLTGIAGSTVGNYMYGQQAGLIPSAATTNAYSPGSINLRSSVANYGI